MNQLYLDTTMKNDPIHLVIVYLGEKIPHYVFANMANISRSFSSVSKTLITSPGARLLDKPQDWSVWTYQESGSDRDLLKRMELPGFFRNGFWKYSYQRFFALSQFHDELESAALLQVEADVAIFPNFPIERMAAVEKLAWMQLEEGEDIPSLIYSPLPTETQFLADYFRTKLEIDPKTSDMRSLFSLRAAYPDRVCLLPDSPSAPNWTLGKGFFDAATIGIWLLGNDPRNEKGWRRTGIQVNSSHSLKMDSLELKVDGNELLVREKAGAWSPLWSIHVHSKINRFFFQPELLQELESRSGSPHTKSFHLAAFFNWALEVWRDFMSEKGRARIQSRIRRIVSR